MPHIDNTKPTIGVSACLFDINCRYNGGNSNDRYILNTLKQYCNIVPYCPEAPILGTPRKAIRLVQYEGEIKALEPETQTDVTSALVQSSNNIIKQMHNDNINGYIFKSKSPSCGMERVKLYEPIGRHNQKIAVGVFANAVINEFSYLPTEEEGRLNDMWLKENFIMQVFAHHHLQQFLNKQPTIGNLVEFHTQYKYLIYSKSSEKYKELGNIVANSHNHSLDQIINKYTQCFLETIQIKSSIGKTYNVLLHMFGYFKKHLHSSEKQGLLLLLDDFKQGIVPLITVIKVLEVYINTHNIEYLQQQVFLNPYPKELALRSDIGAVREF
jgi:uncharacterized protein YbgA (DUF1722 family)/uncharacterized protein YbbK (DUF523 family)